MRVLHIAAYFAPAFTYGGPPRSILGLCQGLRHAGVDVTVFTTTANGQTDLPASPAAGNVYEGIPVHYFPRAFPRRFFGVRGLTGALRTRGKDFDLWHIHGLWNLPVWTAARTARQLGVTYVLSPRGMLNPSALSFRAWRKRIFYHLIERRNLAGAAALHATSEEEARWLTACRQDSEVFVLPNGLDLASIPSLEKGEVFVLPNGLDPVSIPSLEKGAFRQRLGLADGTPLFAFLGRIHRIKRLDLLAEAFLKFRAKRADARLVLAGPFEQEDYCRELRQRLAPAAEAVHWTGHLGVSEKWSLLADATALVVCSDQESFGLSIVEALAVGAPVIVTRTCPWQEVVTAGCGLWVEQDSDAIAAALGQLAADPEAARAMGRRGRLLVAQRYTWEAIASSLAEHYRNIHARVQARRQRLGAYEKRT